jgi:hypothetical protein
MSKLHPVWLLIIGWLVAMVFPPSALFGMVKGKSAG